MFSHFDRIPLRPHEACQAPLSMGFSRQEEWSGLPCHALLHGVLPTQGSNQVSYISGRFFIYRIWESSYIYSIYMVKNVMKKRRQTLYIYITESFFCTAETNTTLYINYAPI